MILASIRLEVDLADGSVGENVAGVVNTNDHVEMWIVFLDSITEDQVTVDSQSSMMIQERIYRGRAVTVFFDYNEFIVVGCRSSKLGFMVGRLWGLIVWHKLWGQGLGQEVVSTAGRSGCMNWLGGPVVGRGAS